ncbi:GntR family transcriptional regulator [Histidinibacterium aquaticum]|uniref:GntR family transcriptional regulator n=1 Tax=Histidinibacterium aquaticum TaxID=2613962 RepID=A0A5J5GCL8_9RHOB|nr:GntR family transcriptional regulator [Histidinibacterium aquaticum]KAA9005542.1 GntR family transcriptional regulator [Histidinibacterium aquaticum]
MTQEETALTLPPLRHETPTPLWLQLKHALRDHITFHLSPGARIPSESALCRYYGLSRMTVRQAITALVNEGLLGRHQGRGTFVMPSRMSIPPRSQAHFLDDGFEATDDLTMQIDETALEPPPRWIRERLGMGAIERAHKIRLNLAADADVLASRTMYIPEHVAPSLPALDLKTPVHRILEESYGLQPAMADETMRLIRADQLRADMLRTEPGKPLILVERVVFLAGGEPVEYARTYYQAERYRFEHKLVRPDAADAGEPEFGERRHLVGG